ncbi:MAG: AhpC/TSA family protein [Rhodothermales bacterium]|nr:AhpC/TSA family protein [Rhodothermales bacterium]MBO6779918.1 AhpC/TSA family protein [Rhodothermales bacterium]
MRLLLPLLLFLAACQAAGPEPEVTQVPADVAPTAWDVSPLLPGMDAPSLELTAADGSTWTLDSDRLDRPVIMTFYRGGWCPYCNRHLAALRNAESELQEMGFDVVFLSADRPEVLKPSLSDSTFNYTLVSDNDLEAARAFGIAYQVDQATIDRYEGTRMDLDEASGRSHYWLPAPATFVISTDGLVQFGYVNPNYRVRVSPEVVMAAARATADHEERLRET